MHTHTLTPPMCTFCVWLYTVNTRAIDLRTTFLHEQNKSKRGSSMRKRQSRAFFHMRRKRVNKE